MLITKVYFKAVNENTSEMSVLVEILTFFYSGKGPSLGPFGPCARASCRGPKGPSKLVIRTWAFLVFWTLSGLCGPLRINLPVWRFGPNLGPFGRLGPIPLRIPEWRKFEVEIPGPKTQALNSHSVDGKLSSIQRKAPRTEKLKDKTSKCALCKKLEANLQSVSNVQENVSIESLAIARKSILLKIIPTKKIMTANQIANLGRKKKNRPKVLQFMRSKVLQSRIFWWVPEQEM